MICTTENLDDRTSCFKCIPKGMRQEVWIYLLCRISQTGISVTPSAPVALPATNAVGGGFTANWNASAGATGYRLDVALDAGFVTFAPGFNNLDVGNVTSVNAYGLINNTTYYYRVRAYKGANTSANSNSITQATLLIAWDPPTVMCTWTDKNGPQSGIMFTFQTTADFATVTDMSWGLFISTITNAGGFPALNNLTLNQSALTSAEFYGQTTIGNTFSCNGSTTFTDITAKDLITITGTLDLRNTTTGGALHFDSLKSVGTINAATSGFTSLNLQSLQTVTSGGFTVNNNTRLTTLTLGSLVSVVGGFSLTSCSNAAFTSVNLTTLQTVTGGSFTLNINNSLTAINLTSLTSFGAGATSVTIGGLGAASISMPSMVNLQITGSFTFANNACVNFNPFPNLQTTAAGLTITGMSFPTTISFPSLVSMGAAFNISGITNATSLSCPNLQTVNGQLQFNNGSKLTSVNFNSLQSVAGNIVAASLSVLTSLSFPALTSCTGALSFSSPLAMTVWSAPNVAPANTKSHTWINGSLQQQYVDAILCQAVPSMITSGSINISGGGNATPSAAGKACTDTLRAVPVTVTLNGY